MHACTLEHKCAHKHTQASHEAHSSAVPGHWGTMSPDIPLPSPAGEIWPTSPARTVFLLPHPGLPRPLPRPANWAPNAHLGFAGSTSTQFAIQICKSFLCWTGCELETERILAVTPFPPPRGPSQSQAVGKGADTHKHVKAAATSIGGRGDTCLGAPGKAEGGR